MRLYRDRAVVLRQHKLGEADRIITLLTREHGLVRAVAKGVRRTRSKFGQNRSGEHCEFDVVREALGECDQIRANKWGLLLRKIPHNQRQRF